MSAAVFFAGAKFKAIGYLQPVSVFWMPSFAKLLTQNGHPNIICYTCSFKYFKKDEVTRENP